MKSKRLFLFQFLCALYVQSSMAQANGVGNGGDRIATEFRAGALSVYEILTSALEPRKLLTKQQLGRLKVAIEETRIDVTNQILVEAEGLTVDARVIKDPMYPNNKGTRAPVSVVGPLLPDFQGWAGRHQRRVDGPGSQGQDEERIWVFIHEPN